MPVNEASQAGANVIKLIKNKGWSDVLIAGIVLGFCCIVDYIREPRAFFEMIQKRTGLFNFYICLFSIHHLSHNIN